MLFAKLRNRHKIFLYWRHTKDIGESERREGSGTKMRDTQTCTITNERASMSSINETVQVIAKEKRIKLSTPGRIIQVSEFCCIKLNQSRRSRKATTGQPATSYDRPAASHQPQPPAAFTPLAASRLHTWRLNFLVLNSCINSKLSLCYYVWRE